MVMTNVRPDRDNVRELGTPDDRFSYTWSYGFSTGLHGVQMYDRKIDHASFTLRSRGCCGRGSHSSCGGSFATIGGRNAWSAAPVPHNARQQSQELRRPDSGAGLRDGERLGERLHDGHVYRRAEGVQHGLQETMPRRHHHQLAAG
jgi:hypothetical protein